MSAPALTVPREIRTGRLLLRSARPGDGPALREALETSRAEHFPWLSFSGKSHDVETLERISGEAQRAFDAGEFYVWRVWSPHARPAGAGAGEPGELELVGTVDLHTIDRAVPSCEVGYWLRTGHTGRGLATEAVGAVLEVAQVGLGALRIEARCDARNERSWRVVERLGFELEGVARQDDRDAGGALTSTRVYSLTHAEV